MTPNRSLRALAAVFLVGMLTSISAAAVHQQPSPVAARPTDESTAGGHVFVNGVRRHDEIVLVNTRMLCGSCDPDSLRTGLRVEEFVISDGTGKRRWQRSDLDRFLAFDSSVPTVIFVHGNQITPSDAKNEGLAMYRRIIRYGADGPPIRFVIFSWPSSKVGRLMRDVRVKATRTGPAGCQLAWLLDQMPPETPVSLVGFSFGARIITGGLHILAGGRLGHLALEERAHSGRPPMNVVFMAAALHANWLGERQYHGLAMTQVNQLFLLNNCRDPAMRFYHLAFKGRGRPQALGLRGPTYISRAQRSQIHRRDMSGYGSRHNLFLYLCAPGVPARIWQYAVGTPAGIQLQAAN